jgi:hypothetical protein
MERGDPGELERRLSGDLASLDDFARELAQIGHGRMSDPSMSEGQGNRPFETAGDAGITARINADPATVEQGLAKLVLSLIELLRRLMEKQALRRIDAGSLTDEEIERMGETFLRLERKMDELKAVFGLEDGDLSLNLGPLGDLLQES